MAKVTIPADTPRREGTCEWCGRVRTVYAFALWVCGACLAADPARGGDR